MLSALGLAEEEDDDSPWDSEVLFYYYFKIQALNELRHKRNAY